MKRILIIEDDLSTQRLYIAALSKAGFEAMTTAKGEEGVFYAKEKNPDLIMLDVMIPGKMNGFDVLESLKADVNTKNIPVIMLTNLDTQEKTAREIGAVDYVVKANTNLEEIIEKVKRFIR